MTSAAANEPPSSTTVSAPEPLHPTQRLAVLVADLVESVRLMRTDESGTIERWGRFVEQVRDICARGGGRIVRSLGDGLMLVFDQVPSAAWAARALHARLADIDPAQDPARCMRLRVGIHVGPVVQGDLDIYGVAVNLAARVVAHAGPGETWVTSEVRDDLIDGLDAELVDLGDVFVKGYAEPVRMYRLGPASQLTPMLTLGERMANLLRPGAAVLPFVPVPGDDPEGLVGEALAEELIGQLARLPELQVISGLSTRSLKGRGVALDELRNRLAVAYVVTGRYRLQGGRLRLQLELTETGRGVIAWAEGLEVRTGELFAGDGARLGELAHQLAAAMLSHELQRAAAQPLPTLESYTLLFGALTLMHRPARRDFDRARAMLEALQARHGRNAVAHAWLAKWHVLRAAQGWSADVQADALQARTHVMLALESDPGHALALAIGGHVHGYFSKDAVAAGQLYRDALSANPNEPLAWLYSSTWHAYRGEPGPAEDAAAMALRLSPLDPMKYYFQTFAATALLAGGHGQRAEGLARESIRMQRGHASTWRTLAYALILQGKGDEARDAVQQLLSLEPTYTVGTFRQRFPGRDGPMAEPFAQALLEAGLPP